MGRVEWVPCTCVFVWSLSFSLSSVSSFIYSLFFFFLPRRCPQHFAAIVYVVCFYRTFFTHIYASFCPLLSLFKSYCVVFLQFFHSLFKPLQQSAAVACCVLFFYLFFYWIFLFSSHQFPSRSIQFISLSHSSSTSFMYLFFLGIFLDNFENVSSIVFIFPSRFPFFSFFPTLGTKWKINQNV